MPQEVVLAIISAASAIIGGFIGFLGTFFQIRTRKWELSGRVSRTDADTLWSTTTQLVQQATQLVQTLADRTVQLTREVSDLVVQVKSSLASLEGDIMQARDMFSTLRQLVDDLRSAIAAQEKAAKDIEHLKTEILHVLNGSSPRKTGDSGYFSEG